MFFFEFSCNIYDWVLSEVFIFNDTKLLCERMLVLDYCIVLNNTMSDTPILIVWLLVYAKSRIWQLYPDSS